MIAMIFAAGLGSRLAPLTSARPKALVSFMGATMLENAARKLVEAGCRRLVVNVHHHAAMMKEFIHAHGLGAEVLISDESGMLLDTGGGMLKAREALCMEPAFVMYNVDVACTLDVGELYRRHLDSGRIATLAVMDRPSTRKLVFDDGMRLCAWRCPGAGQEKIARKAAGPLRELAFSGISVASREIFPLIEERGKFSITDMFLRLAASHDIGGWEHGGLWADLGTPEKLRRAEELFSGTSRGSAGY